LQVDVPGDYLVGTEPVDQVLRREGLICAGAVEFCVWLELITIANDESPVILVLILFVGG